ncbi:NACHT, LRR and PYD domains-containing protein 3 [Chionoecetes opilio]|uniref:NACHT, LRR and PYD domains-containing protein 3 n=1 Tax=Chionoecetes opilio TaxID=41210 RepID=A0A8J8WF13_CHIOP|nr:NACHT, LRR and PYD domains-containing protein 3 [Chionoecetes opilio]
MTASSSINYLRLKLLCILEGPGATVLKETLQRGTRYSPPIYLDEYLLNLPDTSTANYRSLNDKGKKKAFNTPEKKQIKSDPLWDTFDISLLYKCIRLACENVASSDDATRWKDQNEMEGVINKIKEERNTCVHEKGTGLTEPELQAKVVYLKKLFNRTLEAVKVKYGVSDSEIAKVSDKIEKDTKDIMEDFSEKKILQTSFDKLLPMFKEETRNQLKDIYQKCMSLNQLHFLNDKEENRINIQDIFSKINLQVKSKETEIDCYEILEEFSQTSHPRQERRSRLTMISGVAGSGKSTLLNFILSEWLENKNNCRMKYLENYDIVLRILCRERVPSSLQVLLDRILPDIFTMFNDPVVKYLKKCRVLFLIDGLDELNSSSEQLLNDILDIGKDVQGFTFICTSRPERVSDFLAKTRENYQQSEICIKELSPVDRIEFVLKHYVSLPPNGSTSVDKLRQTMENIVWRDYFGLPLNLLFLATLFHEKPEYLKNSSTQSSLYLTIHKWCVEKLKGRLAIKQPMAGENSQIRELGIKRVLKVVYRIALEGLLQGRMSLSEEDFVHLKNRCEEEKLPMEEFMGAFFSLRSSFTKLKNESLRKKNDPMTNDDNDDIIYDVPHKGLQEFFAARHICLQHDLTSGLVDIRRLIQEPLQSQSQTRQDMNNLLLHVAGLLSVGNQPDSGAIEEVVDLLAKTGVKKCEDWLKVLEDTEINDSFLHCVADHDNINNDFQTTVNITDNTVLSASALLPLIHKKEVEIKLQRDHEDLKKLSMALKNHIHKRLKIQHHYKYPGQAALSDSMLQDLPR